jgi:hypothetical protein
MTQEVNNNRHYKCPHCACLFLTAADLQLHLNRFGNQKGEHDYQYRKTHGRLEHGYGEE